MTGRDESGWRGPQQELPVPFGAAWVESFEALSQPTRGYGCPSRWRLCLLRLDDLVTLTRERSRLCPQGAVFAGTACEGRRAMICTLRHRPGLGGSFGLPGGSQPHWRAVRGMTVRETPEVFGGLQLPGAVADAAKAEPCRRKPQNSALASEDQTGTSASAGQPVPYVPSPPKKEWRGERAPLGRAIAPLRTKSCRHQ